MDSYVWMILLVVIYLTFKFVPGLMSSTSKSNYVLPDGGLEEVVGNSFVKQNGSKTSFDESIKGKKLIAIYFSAHWCPPCRGFTPVLKQCYQEWIKQGKSIEIIFCSHDSDNNSFQNYFKNDHGAWVAAEFGSPSITKLQKAFSVRGIPKLVVLDQNGKLIDDNARGTVGKMKQKAITEWMK